MSTVVPFLIDTHNGIPSSAPELHAFRTAQDDSTQVQNRFGSLGVNESPSAAQVTVIANDSDRRAGEAQRSPVPPNPRTLAIGLTGYTSFVPKPFRLAAEQRCRMEVAPRIPTSRQSNWRIP